MKEFLGLWCFDRWNGSPWREVECEVFIEDGVFRIETRRGHSYHSDWVLLKRNLGKRFYGDEEFLMYMDYRQLSRMLRSFDGKTVDEIMVITEADIEDRKRRAEIRKREMEKWESLRDRFGGYVISIERTADVYETGFSVRVLMKTEKSFSERRQFIRENQKDFLMWVMNEITDCPRIMKKIGDIGFYKPVEIVTLRIPETEIKFEVKGELA